MATLAPFFSRSVSFLRRFLPLSAAVVPSYRRIFLPAIPSLRSLSATSSLNDSNCSNRPTKETILLDGCDFEHWLIAMEDPEGNPTRDELIDSYIKTLAQVFGSEEEARMKIYSVSTKYYYAFGALVSAELSNKIKELPKVRYILPDSYLNIREKDYGGEPFINGQAVPYDPKYHEDWHGYHYGGRRCGCGSRLGTRTRRLHGERRDMQTKPPSNPGGFPPNNAGGFPANNSSGYAPPPPGNLGGPLPSNLICSS
ncbi:multiple organellar RNA editing factor 8, chloroplastic/mitochondrial-like [Lotus japonicus]|uniref:multiple organellar RNA editing factor 8, chloroplastic/mitochondrial-like n=1 Tax=Lotus japonicus TaxID=34305 RepID=UPI0025837544|nr:multiple organellar RNA editing factor 8, chloroplastic/mitochondrial-like [Lotus japonicus]